MKKNSAWSRWRRNNYAMNIKKKTFAKIMLIIIVTFICIAIYSLFKM